MAFFAGATNFTVSGGTFNTIAGDLTEHHQHYAVYTVNSYNNYDDDDNYDQHYQPPHGPQPPRGYPPHGYYQGLPHGPGVRHHPQHYHQERGPYGRGAFHDNNFRPEANWGDRSHLETTLNAPGHVEIVEGDFVAHSGRRHSRNYSQDCQASSPSPAATDPLYNNVPDQGITPSTSVNHVVVEEEEEEEMPSVDADVTASTSSPAPAEPPISPFERMRMNLAGITLQEGAELQEMQATDGPSPVQLPADKKRKKPFTFGRKTYKS